MTKSLDFSKARRGPVIGSATGKTRITIRIDDDVLEWFKKRAHEQGGGSYQTMMNQVLRAYVENQEEPLEDTLRRVILEVVPGAKEPKKAKPAAKKKGTKKRA